MFSTLLIIGCIILAIGITTFLIPIVNKISHKIKMFDQPNGRSSIHQVVPTFGGLAILISFAISSRIGLTMNSLNEYADIFIGLLIIASLGFTDDVLDIKPKTKLLGQILTAFVIIFLADVRITNLYGIFGINEIPYVISVALTTLMFIIIINAYNLIDGIDGLASGMGIFATLVLGIWFLINGYQAYAVLSLTLCGSLIGFLIYNVFGTKNKIFMGDTGSMIIGTLVAILIIEFNEFNILPTTKYSLASGPAISFSLLLYPLVDLLKVFIIRILSGKSPFSADKNHTHHRLLVLGMSHKKASLVLIVSNILIIVPAIFIQNLGMVMIMAYNLTISSIIIFFLERSISRAELIKKDDPYQQVIYFDMYKKKAL